MIFVQKVEKWNKSESKVSYEKWLSEKGHELLKGVLKDWYQVKDIEISYEKHGKPFLRERGTEREKIEFNLTHCDGMIGLVIGKEIAGIDAERIRPLSMAAMKKVCSAGEVQRILGSEQKEEMFFRYFTLKEAYGKAAGFGLSYPLKEVNFLVGEKDIRCSKSGYCFRQYKIGNEYILSVCYKKRQEMQREDKLWMKSGQ